jgi:hypothetical protein
LNNHNLTDLALRWFPSLPLHIFGAAVAWRDNIGCCFGCVEKRRCCLNGVTTALPVVEFPLALLAVITTSFTVAELLVLSTDNRNHPKALRAAKLEHL